MRCPKCQTDLPDTAKFCNECGRKIEIGCSQCGHLNPPGSKFCLECGHGLRSSATAPLPKALSFDEKLAKIQKYLPTGLAEEIVAQRDQIGPHLCNQMMFHLRRNCTLYAQLFRQEGGTFKAKEQLSRAIEIYRACGADGWVTKTEEDTARIS